MFKFQKRKSNKSLGNDVEKEFARYMFEQGWWVHIMAYNTNGQPCDIVMSRGNTVWFLDVKNVEGEWFELERVESNQFTAFEMLTSRGTTNCGFAIKIKGKFYFLSYKLYLAFIKSETRKVGIEHLVAF